MYEEKTIIEQIGELIKDIKQKGYVNKLIDYKEFQRLYEPYKNIMSERIFSELLGISESAYMTLKRENCCVKVLKLGRLTEKRKDEIREILRNSGNANRAITYSEFLELFESYKQEVTKREFAEILQINLDIDKNGEKVVILKSNPVSKQRKKEIRGILVNQGYSNKLILYEEFQELYESYKNEMTEREFAQILDIQLSNFRDLKTQGTRAKILKNDIHLERKKEIREYLIHLGYGNKLIDYNKFQELYESYKNEMSEKEFAQILRLTDDNYSKFKNKKRRVRVLYEPEIADERFEEIRWELFYKGYSNKYITYEELQYLYELYKNEMTEKEFVKILGVSNGSYRQMLRKGTRVKTFKKDFDENNEQIRSKLVEDGYSRKLISYDEFLEIYKKYGANMTEIKFAEILGMSYDNYYNIKKRGNRATILKKEKISLKRKEEICDELSMYADKYITYEELKQMYLPYSQEMTEREFANILGIYKENFERIKREKSKTQICIVPKLSAERKIEIKMILMQYPNRDIDYEQFSKLYETYSQEMTEKEFSKMLEISEEDYDNIKNKGESVLVKFNNLQLRMIKYRLSLEKREYKMAELKQLCSIYGITLQELLESLYGKTNFVFYLLQKESIYIGACEMPQEFQEKYAKQFLEVAQKSSKMLCRKYGLKNWKDDLAMDSLVYVMNNKGDLVKNIENEKEALNAINAYIYVYTKYKCIEKLTLKREISLDAPLDNESARSKNLHEKIKDPTFEIKQIPDEQQDYSHNGIVEKMKMYYEEGMDNAQAIDRIINEYGISKEELFKILEEELVKKRKLKKAKDGKVYLGEEKL